MRKSQGLALEHTLFCERKVMYWSTALGDNPVFTQADW